jgi:hypothetical protein
MEKEDSGHDIVWIFFVELNNKSKIGITKIKFIKPNRVDNME